MSYPETRRPINIEWISLFSMTYPCPSFAGNERSCGTVSFCDEDYFAMTSRCQYIYRHGGGNRFGSLVDYRSQVELCAGATMSMRLCSCEHDEVNKRTRLHTESNRGVTCGYVPGRTRPPGRTSMRYFPGHSLLKR